MPLPVPPSSEPFNEEALTNNSQSKGPNFWSKLTGDKVERVEKRKSFGDKPDKRKSYDKYKRKSYDKEKRKSNGEKSDSEKRKSYEKDKRKSQDKEKYNGRKLGSQGEKLNRYKYDFPHNSGTITKSASENSLYEKYRGFHSSDRLISDSSRGGNMNQEGEFNVDDSYSKYSVTSLREHDSCHDYALSNSDEEIARKFTNLTNGSKGAGAMLQKFSGGKSMPSLDRAPQELDRTDHTTVVQNNAAIDNVRPVFPIFGSTSAVTTEEVAVRPPESDQNQSSSEQAIIPDKKPINVDNLDNNQDDVSEKGTLSTVAAHVEYLLSLSVDAISKMQAIQSANTKKPDANQAVEVMNIVAQIIIRAISIHIMLSDTEKWALNAKGEKCFYPISNLQDKTEASTRSKCLEDTRDSLRNICFSVYNFSIAAQAGKYTHNISGWSLIRREAAIQATIKHHISILGNLKEFQWAANDKSPKQSASLPKSKYEISDLCESLTDLQIKLGQLKIAFGEHTGALPTLVKLN